MYQHLAEGSVENFIFGCSCHTAIGGRTRSVRWIRYTRSELIPKRFVMPKRGSEKKTSVLTARVQTETKDAAKEYAKNPEKVFRHLLMQLSKKS